MRTILRLTLPLLLLSCGDGKKDAAEKLEQQEERSRTHVIDLSEHDVPLAVELDPNSLAADTPAVKWNEEAGFLEVKAGERFHIMITEEQGDMDRLKNDLERDMLRKNTILQETPDLLIYKSEFPDGSLVFTHFYKIIENSGRVFVVQSYDQGRFSEDDVRKMAAAVVPARRI